jgi:diguanylate cyclase (GGDEF)-like protein/PAS domain S-box-containing protein
LWLSLFAVLLFILAVIYQTQSRQLLASNHELLQGLSHFKNNHIQLWLSERRSDMKTFYEDTHFIESVKRLPAQPEIERKIRERFQVFMHAYGYERVTLLDSNGRVLVDEGDTLMGRDVSDWQENYGDLAWLSQDRPSLLFADSDFHLDVIAPLVDRSGDSRYVGALVLHVDPRAFLIPFMHDVPTQENTLESWLLVNLNHTPRGFRTQNGNGLHELSLQADAVPLLKILGEQLRQGASEGFVDGLHYRGKPVLLYYQRVNTDSDWLLLTKLDRAEALAPVWNVLSWTAALGVVAMLLLGFGTLHVWEGARSKFRAQQLEEQNAFLEASQQHFIDLFMNAPAAYALLSQEGRILEVNQSWRELFVSGSGLVQGKLIGDFIECDDDFIDALQARDEHGNVYFDRRCRFKGYRTKWVGVRAQVVDRSVAHQLRIHCLFTDITLRTEHELAQKRVLQRTQALFELTVKAPSLDEKSLLQLAVDLMESLSESQIGFVHFVHPDQNQVELMAWSTNTLQKYCTANYESHYPVAQAGIWADSIREARPVVVNNYAEAPHKKGLPEGHSDLARFISVPIVDQELVRMVVGVGNAPRDYDHFDVESLQLFGAELYRIVELKRAYDQLGKSEKRFQHLFVKAPVAYQVLDAEGRLLDVNEAWLRLFGFSADEVAKVIGKPMEQWLSRDCIGTCQAVFHQLVAEGDLQQRTIRVTRLDGTVRDVELTGQTSNTFDGQLRTHCMLVDITDKLQAEKSLRLAAKVFENAGEGIMITDAKRVILSVNKAFTRILGYSEAEAVGQTPRFLHSGKHDEAFYTLLWETLLSSDHWEGEIWNRAKDGTILPEWLTISALKNEQGEVENYIGVFADISRLKDSEDKIAFMAFYDTLTALPNRIQFMSNLEYALSHSRSHEHGLAVLMLDLDRFKDVNDSYGHAMGDEVLQQVGAILQAHAREIDTVARFGGDGFAVIVENLPHPEEAGRVARKLIDAISEPMQLSNDKVISIGCSVGISLYPQHARDPNVLVQQADSALYLSKQKKSGGFEYFTGEMTDKAQERISIEVALKNAVRQQQLRVHYQPQVSLASGRIKGAEALVRWQHPTLGLVAPAYFIGVAEESGLIADIGDWVLKETCRQIRRWREQGYEGLVFAVNVSPKQMVYNDLTESVRQALAQSGIPAECLELEITESGLMAAGDKAVRQFEELRALGVRIAIDDFGTGYSSLAYLKNLPLDVLKIDKQFVDDIPDNEDGMQIVNTIIAMAHSLHLKVLAEGVESEVQRDFLSSRGCDLYQGYLMSPPVNAEDFERLFLKPEGDTPKESDQPKPH